MKLPPFVNEPYTDFTEPVARKAQQDAIDAVRAQLGREYPLLIAGERVTTGNLLISTNPSNPKEIIGRHHKATPDLANKAVEEANRHFHAWSHTLAEDRAAMLLRAAEILRSSKFEFNAWLSLEAGKTWPEAEAETAEAIDFCEYYARQMLRFLPADDARADYRARRTQIDYLRLGVGVVIPPWNFALAILAGMTTAALVTGNTAVLKPSSETPTDCAEVRRGAAGGGVPACSASRC